MITKRRNHWLAECQGYLVDNERWGLWPWKDQLINWLVEDGQSALAEKVRAVQLEFQDDTDLAWAHQAQTEGLRLIKEIIKMAKNPLDRIFLSHSSADKNRVRDYHKTLTQLGYNSWLDEDAMTAGVPLERSLLEGMKSSVAAVFFITPAFKDNRYLSAEVDYAVAEKTQRGEGFAIITLVLASGDPEPEVPDLLRRFVWKRPASDLEGLREIIRAIPAGTTFGA